MCAEFTISMHLLEIAAELGVGVDSSATNFEWPSRYLPRSTAPIIFRPQAAPIITPMQFSLVPSWSKERQVKFATHNARLDSITEKATWKKPFRAQRALLPLNGFIEPSYSGELAGNMIRFTSDKTPLLLAAALYDRWIDPATKGELLSFAIVTDEPSEVVRSVGHDRQPVFMNRDSILSWLNPELTENGAIKALIKENSITPELKTEIARPMKAGWEKRAKG